MGVLSPEAARPLTNGRSVLLLPLNSPLRCRQHARPSTGQHQSSSTSTDKAPTVFVRRISEPHIRSHRRLISSIAHSSAAPSFDATPEEPVSESSTNFSDIDTGEVREVLDVRHGSWQAV